jgi:two-component system sensor histidine kinase KdpD
MATLTSKTLNYIWAAAAVAAAVFLLASVRPHVNITTAALGLVMVVMLTAVRWGSGPALFNSVIGLLSFNYFFIPPIHTWTIADPENWIAFGAFLIVAVVVGQLSSHAKQKTVESESRRRQLQRLYEELQRTFEEASEAQSLRRSEKLKTALLDAVTHDLRTPLTSIKGAATTLLRNDDSMSGDVRRELLTVIDEESDRLNRFVEEMMELAQIEGGHLKLRRTATATSEIVNAALDRASLVLAPHPVEVTLDDQLPLLEVDAASVAGVVFELLENAARYSGSGRRIAVRARQVEPSWVELAVEDEGPGIAPEDRERIFEKFFRAPHRANDGHGFGVGLAIARGIVEAHGGKIWAEARHGSGSVLRFTVPCQGPAA